MDRARIGVDRPGYLSAREIAARSRHAVLRPLAFGAELTISEVSDEAILLGAYQRGASLGAKHAKCTLYRRSSGGPAVLVGPGTVHVLLVLENASSLVACEPAKIVNRYVRPLLRALTRVGATAHYFGRDWISVAHRPAAWVGFAHSLGTGRCIFEAFLAVTHPFAIERASFLGKEPGTLSSITGQAFEVARLVDAIAEAYPKAYDRPAVSIVTTGKGEADEDLRADPPWAAVCPEAIGEIAAGYDRLGALRIGGALMVTDEAIEGATKDLAALAPSATEADIARIVESRFAAPGVALEGVRTRASLVDVITRARAEKP